MDGTRRRIAVVNNDPAFLQLVNDVLEQEGPYEVFTYRDEETSLAELRAARPELIIIDILVGGAPSGWELALLAGADSTLGPVSGPRPRPREPKIDPNRSPSPPSPPTSKSSNLNDPPPGDAPGRAPRGRACPVEPEKSNAPSRRMSSYCFRFSALPRTVYASEIALKRSAAFGSLRFVSGWYCFASRRYCFLMSSADAADGTPSTA